MVLLFCLTTGLAVIFGLGFPQTGQYAVYIPYLIGVLLFFNFLDVKIQLRRSYPWLLIVALFLSAAAIPGLTYYFLSVPFSGPYRTGLLLVACAPTGITTLVLGRYIRGSNYNLVLSTFFFITFASVFYIPFLLEFLLDQDIRLETSPYTLLVQLALLVVLPYLLSQIAVRFLRQQWLVDYPNISKGATLILIFCIVCIPCICGGKWIATQIYPSDSRKLLYYLYFLHCLKSGYCQVTVKINAVSPIFCILKIGFATLLMIGSISSNSQRGFF